MQLEVDGDDEESYGRNRSGVKVGRTMIKSISGRDPDAGIPIHIPISTGTSLYTCTPRKKKKSQFSNQVRNYYKHSIRAGSK